MKYVILICLYCECKCQNVDLYSVIYMSSRDNLLIENVLKNILSNEFLLLSFSGTENIL